MEQRPLRLGDLVDDYCPRERRVTNHAIVAIVNDSIRQTRCTACEAEHTYKGGHAPRRRVRPAGDASAPDNAGGQLVAPVSADATAAAEPDTEPAAFEESERADAGEAAGAERGEGVPAGRAEPGPEAEAKPPGSEAQDDGHLWPANRQLIRATLPRTEGDVPPPRPIPEFTIYQRQNGRGRGYQPGRGWNDRGNVGNGARGDRRSGPGFGGQGQGQGQGQARRRHGKRRPR
jgi:hypothetical protein